MRKDSLFKASGVDPSRLEHEMAAVGRRKTTVKGPQETMVSKSKKSDDVRDEAEILRAWKKEQALKDKNKGANDKANRRLQKEKEAMAGNWGGDRVVTTGLAEGQSKLTPHAAPQERGQVGQARARLRELYDFNWNPPECFVAQMAFSQHNGFLLSTDGRLFSWGKDGPVLGRFVGSEMRNRLIDDNVKRAPRSIDIGEIELPGNASELAISKIACGREHVLALDVKGHVWAWGVNSRGQLGFPDTAVGDPLGQPRRVKGLSSICQIYCGDYNSFAVSEHGCIHAFGANEDNVLLTDQLEAGKSCATVREPQEMQLPDYFEKANRLHVQQNFRKTFDLFEA